MINTSNITCPKCGAEIPLTEAVSHRIREELAADFEQQRQEQNAALAEREGKLAKLKNELDQQAKSVNEAVAQQLAAERTKLAAEARQQAEEKLGVQLNDLRDQVGKQQARLRQAQAAELELLTQKKDLEEARERLDLELAKRLDSERKQIADKAREQGVETERLRVAEKEEVIKGLQEQIAALKQRAEQGSTQLQGESLEVTLEESLRQSFPYDEILEIKKGERGADVKQLVRTNAGLDCGTILWEAKRARNWAASWTEKLKENQREAKAELAVLVTTCPPPGLRGIGQQDGVWVCEPVFACVLAKALRHGLVGTAIQRTQESGRADKMTQLYDYLCSVEFRQHIEGVVESFVGLQEQLAAEQRVFARQWKEREQQITKAIQHTASLYGSIQGIAGRASLPEIQSLQLPATAEPGAETKSPKSEPAA
jgi:hypothetical protein